MKYEKQNCILISLQIISVFCITICFFLWTNHIAHISSSADDGTLPNLRPKYRAVEKGSHKRRTLIYDEMHNAWA